MGDLKAVAVSIPEVELELLVRPFGGWFVVTDDGGYVVENVIAFDDDPQQAWLAAIEYLNELAVAAKAERPGGETKVDLTNWNPEDDE